ncbi:OmpA family protein, partial [Amylibacter sp.]|nr:OmpA family protein [Amylibacter sp.]
MTSIKITVTALALLGLAACDSDGSIGGYGSNNGILQSSLDPAGVEYFNQEIGDTVLFLVDQSSLTAEATDLLNKQAEWLLNNTDKSITIEGHADETGTREYNLALGARRAASV